MLDLDIDIDYTSTMLNNDANNWFDISEHKEDDIDREEARKIVDSALKACHASDALEAINVGMPKRNVRIGPRFTVESWNIWYNNVM